MNPLSALAGRLLKRETLYVSLITIVLGVFIGTAISSVRDDSLTIDETAHIVAGYVSLRYGSANLNPEHPPLVKLVSAIPLLGLETGYRPSTAPFPDQWEQGHRFLFSESGISDVILYRSRIAVITLNALLLAAIAVLAWNVLLNRALVPILLAVLAFSPTLLAHARYVTTDTPVALSIVILVLALLRHQRTERKRTPWLVAFALSLVLLTKFSGLPAFALGIVIFALLDRDSLYRRRSLLLVIILPLLATYAVYAASAWNTPVRDVDRMVRDSALPRATREVAVTLSRSPLTRPVPLFAIGAVNAAARSELRMGTAFTQFLDGEGRSDRGWPEYFFKATLYKETPAFFALLATSCLILAIVAMLKVARRDPAIIPLPTLAIPLVFFALYAVAAATGDLNIGLRHFLPALSALALWCILVLDWTLAQSPRDLSLLLLSGAVAAATLQAFSMATTYPYFLSYFNQWSGGTANGYRHLTDSNLDWGEQLKRLSSWVYAEGIPEIKVDYWGKSPLNTYDPEGRLTPWSIDRGRPEGYFAINTQWITHSKWARSQSKAVSDYGYLESIRPIQTFGAGLWVYDLRPENVPVP